MNVRPCIKIRITLFDAFIHLVCVFVLLFHWLFFYQLQLDIDKLVSDDFISTLPGIGLEDYFSEFSPLFSSLFFILTYILNKFPYVLNYPFKITLDNAERQYSNVTRMSRLLTLFFLCIMFLLFVIVSNLIAIDFQWIILAILVALLFGVFSTMVYYLKRSYKLK